MKIQDLFKTHLTNQIIPDPYIIAEAGVNHEGKIDLAKQLVYEAKEGGADAIKFQTYKAETIASKSAPSYWDTTKESIKSQFELFKKYDKFWKKEYEELKQLCDEVDIEFLSTPFDIESANFLNDLMPAFKISSSDITNKPFIDFICQFKKPIVLSTGASYLYEIQEAVEWIYKNENELALLHCILNYPTNDNNAHLGMIKDLIKRFPDYIIGYSDHTLPNDMKVLEMSYLLGAKIIEKHFTHDKTLPGNDHYHAMDKNDLKRFREIVFRNKEILGSFYKSPIETEATSRLNARRSIVIDKKLQKGQTISIDDITFKRPGRGISAKHFHDIIGRKVNRDLKEDDILQWEFLER